MTKKNVEWRGGWNSPKLFVIYGGQMIPSGLGGGDDPDDPPGSVSECQTCVWRHSSILSHPNIIIRLTSNSRGISCKSAHMRKAYFQLGSVMCRCHYTSAACRPREKNPSPSPEQLHTIPRSCRPRNTPPPSSRPTVPPRCRPRDNSPSLISRPKD